MRINENLKLILTSGILSIAGSLVATAAVATSTLSDNFEFCKTCKVVVEYQNEDTSIKCPTVVINTADYNFNNIPVGEKCLRKFNLNYDWKHLDNGGWIGDVLPSGFHS